MLLQIKDPKLSKKILDADKKFKDLLKEYDIVLEPYNDSGDLLFTRTEQRNAVEDAEMSDGFTTTKFQEQAGEFILGTIRNELQPVYDSGNDELMGLVEGSGTIHWSHNIDLKAYSKMTTPSTVPTKTGPWNCGAINPLAGTAKTTNIKIVNHTAPNDPEDLKDMQTWKSKGILTDPKSGHTLTKMHQIRARFGGPGDKKNMFLGTPLSNNHHPKSHNAVVESKIDTALAIKSYKSNWVEYKVTPGFGTIANHVQSKINSKLKGKDKTDAEAWCKEATPAKYDTEWTHYLIDASNVTISKTYTDRLDADIT
ncbi:MAG: hypothetical protein F6K48_23135 [Okeania sp. SIO3H1]|nr:hypothetical protein [Okeania sp. SIO3H1]